MKEQLETALPYRKCMEGESGDVGKRLLDMLPKVLHKTKLIAMKITALTFLIMLICVSTFSQNISLKLFVEDAIGRKDTLIFGYNDSSTLGIDTLFGEENIFSSPFDSLDIRVIQRDSLHFNCIRESHYGSSAAPNLYFPNNIDSKIDYRPFIYFTPAYNNFEIFISAFNYPVTIRTDFSQIQFSFLEGYSSIYLLNNNCDAINTSLILYSPTSDSLFTLTDSTLNTLVANFQHEVGLAEENSKDNLINVSPNPFCTQTTIWTNFPIHNASLKVDNSVGQTVKELKDISEQPLVFNRDNFPDGLYFVRLIHDNQVIATKKVVLTN